jgi:hypothetical protein
MRATESTMNHDIVVRLREIDNRTPFAKSIIMEGAAEIERLRAAIRKHRLQVWGSDEPDHASDAELYRAVGANR